MQADAFHAFLFCLKDHCFEVVDMRVNVAVREQTEEVQGAVVVFHIGDKLAPCGGLKHFAAFYRLRYELCALRKHLTGTERVVADLTVAHVIIGRQTDSGAVRLERYHRARCHELVKRGGECAADRVRGACGCDADTVHNDCQHGTCNALKILKLFELF